MRMIRNQTKSSLMSFWPSRLGKLKYYFREFQGAFHIFTDSWAVWKWCFRRSYHFSHSFLPILRSEISTYVQLGMHIVFVLENRELVMWLVFQMSYTDQSFLTSDGHQEDRVVGEFLPQARHFLVPRWYPNYESKLEIILRVVQPRYSRWLYISLPTSLYPYLPGSGVL